MLTGNTPPKKEFPWPYMGYPWISQDTIFVAAYCPLRVGFLQFRHSQSGASTGKLLSITLQGKVWTFVHFRHEKLTTCVYQNLAHTCPYPYHTMHILYSCTSILCESMWRYLAQDQSLSDLPFISLSQTCPNWVCKDGKVQSCFPIFPDTSGHNSHSPSPSYGIPGIPHLRASLRQRQCLKRRLIFALPLAHHMRYPG